MLWQIIKKSLSLISGANKPVDPHNSNQLLQSAIERHQAGNLQEADAIYQSVLREQPDNTDALHLSGLVAHQVGNSEIAVELIEKAININPAVADFYNNCGEAYRVLLNYDLAITRYEQAISIRPDFADAYNNLGNALNELGQTEQATSHFEHALAIKPDMAEAHNNLGWSLLELGRIEQAIVHCEQALAINPDMAEAHNNLGNALYAAGNFEEAIRSYEQALAIKTDYADAHNNLGGVLLDLGKTDNALAHFEQALIINPDHVATHNNLGLVLQELGRRDKAIASYERALAIKPDYSEVHNHLAMIKPMQEQIPVIEKLLANPAIAEKDEMYYHYALGRIYNENGNFDKEFEHHHKANKLKRLTLTYDSNDHSIYLDSLINAYSRDYYQETVSYGSDSELPVFIVGMPRSGTTLVEQIISNHPLVYGAGELTSIERFEKEISQQLEPSDHYPECMLVCNESTINEFSGKYLTELNDYSQNAMRITDKNPGNFLRIGLIKTLFPLARIIHCKRDALDTCTSIYLNFFVHGNEYSFDLADIGQYYLDYERLMEHWNRLFSADIFDVQYEELVMNQESVSRQLIEYLGLEWNEKCLDFHLNKRAVRTASNLQVRQPIYKNSISRWKHYEKHLDPLKAILQHPI